MEIKVLGNNPNGNRRATNFIVLHHAAATYARGRAIEKIYEFHAGQWPDYDATAYHVIIQEDNDGIWRAYQTLKSFNQIGAGVYGRNHESVHICIADNFTVKHPTVHQMQVAAEVTNELQQRYPLAKVVSHKDIDLPGYGTECPGTLRDIRWSDFLALVSYEPNYLSLWGQKFPYIPHWGIPTYWRENTELGECISHEIYTTEYVIQHFRHGLVIYEIETGRANHTFYEGVFLS